MYSIKPVVFAIAASLVYAAAVATLRKKRVQGTIYKLLTDSRQYFGL